MFVPNLTIIIGLSTYVLFTLLVGLYAGRRVRGSVDFIVAGRRLGIVLATGTLAATWFGGGIVIGAASQAYSHGFMGIIADPLGAALCLFLAGFFYVRMMRRMGLTTIASFFEIRFGPHAGLIASLCTIPAYVGWVASLMVAFGRILQAVAGLDATLGICIGAVIVLIYTTVGGMWAVTLTDFIQVIVLTIGLLIITPMLISEMNGWAAIRAQIPDDRFYLYPRSAEFSTWFSYARDWLVIGLGNLAGQDLIQRSLSSKNESVAQNSAYFSGILYLTVGMLPVFLGISATLIFPNMADPDLVMMKLGMRYLTPIALALFLGALVSALMSSADSALLAPASVIGWDLVRYFKPDTDERSILQICRISVPILGVFSLYLALAHNTVYTLMVDSWSILLATLFVPLTAGIWWPKANLTGAVSAMISGLISWLIFMRIFPSLPADLLAVPVSLLFLTAASLATGKRDVPNPLKDLSGNRLEFRDRLGVLGLGSSPNLDQKVL
ncbi:MAG TPA: sodium:solute symporter [Candidatus Latescibacteria bacterium]|nr:sodium:solute symporter [Candidatus Latescibacterota bacterium]|tara:strand:- start:1104 stop:2597 length:1494 start_codon:yes stop_codon:yes gene_type:complete